MALVFAGITPHTPLILPSVGSTYVEKVHKTRAQMETLAHELYAAQPDTLLLLTPHAASVAGAFTIEIAESFHGTLEQFGDFSLTVDFPGDTAFAHRLQRRADAHHIPTVLQSHSSLDYGATVPLLFLESHFPKLSLIPISDSTLDVETHFRLGQIIRKEIDKHQRRVAVLASADLTNRGERKRYEITERREPYDAAILRALEQQEGKRLLEMPPTIPQDANECGFHSLLTFFGIIEGLNYHADILSYEAPVGVGFLVSHITPA